MSNKKWWWWWWWLTHLVLGPGTRGTRRCVRVDVRTEEDFVWGREDECVTNQQVGYDVSFFFWLRVRETDGASTDVHWKRRRSGPGKLRRRRFPI